MKPAKAWQAILDGNCNIRIGDAVKLAEAFGYQRVRTAGSHRIMKHPKVPDLLNLQSRPDGKAKAYQLRQLVSYVTQYGLTMEGEE